MSVPTRTENLDNLYTTTFNNRRKAVVDNIFDDQPFYYYLRKMNGFKIDGTGGRYIEVPISYAKNDTVNSLSKGDTISIDDTAFLTTAQYEWKFVAGSIIRYYTDDAKNKSKQAHLNLANAKIDNLRMSITDKLEEYFFSDGTGNSSKDPEGLGNLVDDSPTSSVSVGNINQSTYSWWRNQQKSATGAASVYLVTDMRTLANDCSKGQASAVPNFYVTDQTSFELYEEEVVEQKQIVNKIMGDTDFQTLEFRGKPVMWAGNCTSGYLYALNSEYLSLIYDPDIFFAPTEWKTIPNQLDRVMQVVCKLNLIASRRKSLGVLTGISA